jgi:hypothetical protein
MFPHVRAPIAFVGLIGCLACGSARADEFAWELTGLVSEADQVSFLETDFWSLQATHFFDPVDDANGPYALAAFLDPSTRVSVAVSHEERTIAAGISGIGGLPVFTPVVVEADAYAVSGLYLLPQSKWYFGGRYTESDIGDSASFEQPENGYGVLVGKYLGSATTLEAAWNVYESEREFPVGSFCIVGQPCTVLGTGESKRQQELASVSVLHVRRSRSMTYSLSGRIAGSRANVSLKTPAVTLPPPFNSTFPAIDSSFSLPRLQSYFVGGEVFPTAKLGLRLGYTRWDDDTPADDAYDVAATWFVRRDFGIQFIYSRQNFDDIGSIFLFTDDDFDAADTATIRLIGRL